MQSTVTNPDRLSRLNSVATGEMAKAKLPHNSVVRAARILDLAITRSGILKKELGDDKPQITKRLKGDSPDKLWFHEMLTMWPPEVWCELLPLIALEVCPGRFIVERTIAIKETQTTLREKAR